MIPFDAAEGRERRPLFDTVLLPHRSLSPAGFRLLMASLVAAFGAVGVVFTALGAWPVLPFCGAELVLIYWAFRVNDRDARLKAGIAALAP